MSFRPANSAQRRAKVVQAGEGMRLNVQGIVFSYKAVGEDTEGRYALTEGMVPRLIMGHRNTSILGTTRRSMSSKASLSPGRFALLPKGLPHRFQNLSDKPGKVLCVQSPSESRNSLST
jgi:hypothetical protein